MSTLFCTSLFILTVTVGISPGVDTIKSLLLPLNDGYSHIFLFPPRYGFLLILPGLFATAHGFLYAASIQVTAMGQSKLLPEILGKTILRNDKQINENPSEIRRDTEVDINKNKIPKWTLLWSSMVSQKPRNNSSTSETPRNILFTSRPNQQNESNTTPPPSPSTPGETKDNRKSYDLTLRDTNGSEISGQEDRDTLESSTSTIPITNNPMIKKSKSKLHESVSSTPNHSSSLFSQTTNPTILQYNITPNSLIILSILCYILCIISKMSSLFESVLFPLSTCCACLMYLFILLSYMIFKIKYSNCKRYFVNIFGITSAIISFIIFSLCGISILFIRPIVDIYYYTTKQETSFSSTAAETTDHFKYNTLDSIYVPIVFIIMIIGLTLYFHYIAKHRMHYSISEQNELFKLLLLHRKYQMTIL